MRPDPIGSNSHSVQADLDLSWIAPSLAVGSSFPSAAIPVLGALFIRKVVDLRLEAKDDEEALGAYGISLLHLPTADGCGLSVEMLERGVAWVSQQLDAEERVCIHCQNGVGRSVLLCLCVLVHRGIEPLEALRLVKQAREQTSPNSSQLQAFLDWCRRFKARAQPPPRWELPSLQVLMGIVYRWGQSFQGGGG